MYVLFADEMLEALGVAYTYLEFERIIEYKKTWVRRFVPPLQQQKAVECYCLPKGDGCSDLLWHAFSYELVECLEGKDAQEALRRIKKEEAILLTSTDGVGYYVPDASAITPSYLELVDDIVFTDIDFKWTYAKTHEAMFGPYFFTAQ